MTQVSAFIDSQRVFSFVSVHLSVSFLVSRLLVAVHPGWTTTDQIRVVNWIWPSLGVRRPRGPSVSAPAYIHDDCLLSSLWKISPNQRTGAANISPFRSKGLSASANTLVCEWLRAQTDSFIMASDYFYSSTTIIHHHTRRLTAAFVSV